MLYQRWPWHLLFWIGYAFFRFWPYYITVQYYPVIFLQYMFISELFFVIITYYTIWLYNKLFDRAKYFSYFLIGGISWITYLWGRTEFQFSYLHNERRFQGNTFNDIMFNNIALVIFYFLFITACKYFKNGYISQQFESERKKQQLLAEVKNLKSQIAPHFLFNTLNNLYGLAVDKSDKLPDLMLRLSNLLRHSLYETQKLYVPVNEEINVIKSYIELESIRLENSLQLKFENEVPAASPYQIAPLILIVFIENAFKHSKLVQPGPVNIYIGTALENDKFILMVKNNYNLKDEASCNGLGFSNVKRRLELLYPQYQLSVSRGEEYFTVSLQLLLTKVD
jgi:hypothetical protein